MLDFSQGVPGWVILLGLALLLWLVDRVFNSGRRASRDVASQMPGPVQRPAYVGCMIGILVVFLALSAIVGFVLLGGMAHPWHETGRDVALIPSGRQGLATVGLGIVSLFVLAWVVVPRPE